jgi:SNF2 family DNA or RNA helicase
LANNQQEYDAHETQAIGRIRRFGQSKKVHVWRFLARNTIDTKIFDERSSHATAAITTNSNNSDSQE